ncbi:hypothetical protein HU200_055705 [Digitaria exilis]|uniref:C3H1-type domain-containing protein n=1 Tax=Digitaria exilis TaxID=1010633 RepID=A0A835E5V1_9POAL|nr:hypothetical protein HU200_055705 [Digitaria exilis]
MEKDQQGYPLAASASAAAGASRWEASLDGVIVLPAGSAAPRPPAPPPLHARQQREREREREREKPGAEGVFVGDHHHHSEPPEKVFYKTRLCEKFEAGKCAYEDGCNFAHGQAELRQPLPVPFALKRRTPPPAGADGPYGGGGYYGKVCFEFRDKGSCHFGERCAYTHASAAEVAEMRYPGGPRSVEHALRNAPPSARAALLMPAPSGGAPRGSSSGSYAPAAARAFPTPVAATGEDDVKLSRLELLSRKKTTGIYGDWPEED